MANPNATELASMLGCRFDFRQYFPAHEGPFVCDFKGTVVAVQVPHPGSGIETALLVHQDGFPNPEYVDFEGLTFTPL